MVAFPDWKVPETPRGLLCLPDVYGNIVIFKPHAIEHMLVF